MSGKVLVQEREGAVEGLLLQLLVERAERVVFVAERVTGWIHEDRRILAEAAEPRFERRRLVSREEPVVLRVVALYRRGELRPIGMAIVVETDNAVERHHCL